MRLPLILAAMGLVAALIVLFVLAGSDDSSTSSDTVHRSMTDGGNAARPVVRSPSPSPSPSPSLAKAKGQGQKSSSMAPTLPVPGSAPREMIAFDGTRVRDNRTGDGPMRDPNAPFRRPLSTTRLDPSLASKMGAVLRKEAVRCQKEHQGEIGEAARVQPRTTFSVQEERLVVSDVEISLTNIEQGGEFESCLRSAVLGLSVDAPGHPDIKQHSMMVPFTLRPLKSRD